MHATRLCIRHVEGVVSSGMTSWSCSQTCGARGAATHASGAMRSDTRAATRLVSDWLLLPINTPRPQLISNHPAHLKVSEKRERESRKRKLEFRSFSILFRQFLRVFENSYSARFESTSEEGSAQVKISPDVGLLVKVKKRVRIAEDGHGVKATVNQKL